MALPTHSRRGWKGLPEINALAYFENYQLTAVKCFIRLTPGRRSVRHPRVRCQTQPRVCQPLRPVYY